MKKPMITTTRRAWVIQIPDKFPILKEMFLKTVVRVLVSYNFCITPSRARRMEGLALGLDADAGWRLAPIHPH
jgi:hypothetical protein